MTQEGICLCLGKLTIPVNDKTLPSISPLILIWTTYDSLSRTSRCRSYAQRTIQIQCLKESLGFHRWVTVGMHADPEEHPVKDSIDTHWYCWLQIMHESMAIVEKCSGIDRVCLARSRNSQKVSSRRTDVFPDSYNSRRSLEAFAKLMSARAISSLFGSLF